MRGSHFNLLEWVDNLAHLVHAPRIVQDWLCDKVDAQYM